MFRDKPIQYPDENSLLGRYLGPKIDVVLEITAKIMKANGEVVHPSKYRGLKKDENTNQAQILLRNEFDKTIRDWLGPDFLPDNFPDVHLEDTPLYEMYEDDTIDAEGDLTDKTEEDKDPLWIGPRVSNT